MIDIQKLGVDNLYNRTEKASSDFTLEPYLKKDQVIVTVTWLACQRHTSNCVDPRPSATERRAAYTACF